MLARIRTERSSSYIQLPPLKELSAPKRVVENMARFCGTGTQYNISRAFKSMSRRAFSSTYKLRPSFFPATACSFGTGTDTPAPCRMPCGPKSVTRMSMTRLPVTAASAPRSTWPGLTEELLRMTASPCPWSEVFHFNGNLFLIDREFSMSIARTSSTSMTRSVSGRCMKSVGVMSRVFWKANDGRSARSISKYPCGGRTVSCCPPAPAPRVSRRIRSGGMSAPLRRNRH